MTEIRVIKTEAPTVFDPPVDVLYLTYYRYDEAGNRVRKKRYKYNGSDPDPVFVTEGSNPSWALQSDEFYVRDVSGKEIAIYSGSSLTQWNIWGLDNVGKINADTTRNYYLKDHLGSIRVVLNSTNTVISAQDYDACLTYTAQAGEVGYPLQNRTYNSSAMKYDFTGKERDNETSYDYFGARYYDSRIGRWGQVEPLLDKYVSVTPYCYALNVPVILSDINGLSPSDVRLKGQDKTKILNALQQEMPNLNISMDKSGKLSYSGDASNSRELLMQNAIDNPNVENNIITTRENGYYDEKGEIQLIVVDSYEGNKVNKAGVAVTKQYFNFDHAVKWSKLGGGSVGMSVVHAILESYIGGRDYPNSSHDQSYENAHNRIQSMEDAKYNIIERQENTILNTETGIQTFNSMGIRNIITDESKILYTKEQLP